MKRQPIIQDPLAALTAQALFAKDRRKAPEGDRGGRNAWQRHVSRWLAGLPGRARSKEKP